MMDNEAGAARRETVRVLLVEDNPGDARLVEIMLSEPGLMRDFEITHASRLGEAVEALEGSPFDVVLLDLSLPDSSGMETVERVRTAASRTPVVVLSGQDDEQTALRALQGGAEDYLVKGRGDGDLVARAIRYAIQRKKAEERLAYLAQYDPLTGLANRALFQDRLQQAVARAERSGGQLALLFVDLDRFKAVNDTFGHDCGDLLLREVAGRMEARVRKSDTVARLGGDEFAIILEDISEAEDAARVAQDMQRRLSEPVLLSGDEVPAAASIGIALWPGSGGDRLLKDADAAMYRAKRQGGNRQQFYTEEMNVQATARLTLERDLRRALQDEQFVLYYQPQVDLSTGRVIGAEALLRWRHLDRGLVSPGEFIPILEESRLINPVGRWALGAACRQGRSWREAGLAPVRISVNLSARQFGRRDLADDIAGALAEGGMAQEDLELEITESLLMEDPETALATLERLRKELGGVGISIDDFGTGYSSLYRLKELPVQRIKIDRSFVLGVPEDPGDAAITSAVIRLAHDLGLGVVAEGVETAEQRDFLRDRGCDEAQGYLFGRAVPAEEFARLLDPGRHPTRVPVDIPSGGPAGSAG
jgi:diguanylate cyclase (GGDEF)-like protein